VFFLKIRDIIHQVEFLHDLGDVFRGDHTLFVGILQDIWQELEKRNNNLAYLNFRVTKINAHQKRTFFLRHNIN